MTSLFLAFRIMINNIIITINKHHNNFKIALIGLNLLFSKVGCHLSKTWLVVFKQGREHGLGCLALLGLNPEANTWEQLGHSSLQGLQIRTLHAVIA